MRFIKIYDFLETFWNKKISFREEIVWRNLVKVVNFIELQRYNPTVAYLKAQNKESCGLNYKLFETGKYLYITILQPFGLTSKDISLSFQWIYQSQSELTSKSRDRVTHKINIIIIRGRGSWRHGWLTKNQLIKSNRC